MTELGDLLAAAGYSSGDFVPVVTLSRHVTNSSSRSNSSFSTAAGTFEAPFQFDLLNFDQLEAAFLARASANGDEIFVRVRNTTDSTTLIGPGSTTNDFDNFLVGPTSISPSTTSSPVTLRAQIRNSDGATSVELFELQVLIGGRL